MNLLSTSLLALWFLLSSTVKTTVLSRLAAGGSRFHGKDENP